MNQVLVWLSGGDKRSDGMSDQVAEIVIENPSIFPDLYEGLKEGDAVLRGRTCDTLEKIARKQPDLIEPHVSDLIVLARSDRSMVVKMHLAMTFGHMAVYQQHSSDLVDVLLYLLSDEYIFVRSWSISSLCIMARKYPDFVEVITNRIAEQQFSDSPAIRSRTRVALNILTDRKYPFPDGWNKSELVNDL